MYIINKNLRIPVLDTSNDNRHPKEFPFNKNLNRITLKMKKQKTQFLLFGVLLLSFAAAVLFIPFGTAASNDRNSKNKLSASDSPSEKPSNYDAFLDSPRRVETEFSQKGRQTALELINQFEPRLGVPTFIMTGGAQTQNGAKNLKQNFSPAELENKAKFHIGEYSAQYRLSKSDLLSLETASIHDTGKGAIIVKFKQNIDGIEVFRDEMNVVMNRNLELIALSGYLTGISGGDGASNRFFSIQPEDAIAGAVKDLTGSDINIAFLSRTEDHRNAENVKPQNKYIVFQAGEHAAENVSFSPASPLRVKQVFYHLPEGFVPAYYVEANVVSGADTKTPEDLYYSYVISASDGQILFRNNLSAEQTFTYRAWADDPNLIPFDGLQGNIATPHPTGDPDNYSPPYVPQSLFTLQNYPFSQMDPWLPGGATETTGNNVDAYADLVAPDGYNVGDLRPGLTGPDTFDYSFDQTMPRTNTDQRNMAIMQLFYNTNFLHDWFYDPGFNEQAGNAQFDNFGRGGLGGDRMRAEAQDYSGRNNANMSTPADGASPRMQMYLFDGVADSYLFVNSPAGIAGRKDVGIATGFGPQVFDATGDIVIALDPADGSGPSTTDGCSALTNSAEIAGRIALIDRGTCAFTIKVQNAQNAGAIGVIIADNLAGAVANMGGTAGGITIPSLRITLADGNSIKSALAGNTVNTRLFRGANPGDLDGTLDNQIVAHEWGHYISNRLIGNANGLVNNQGRGMGEGWGDFHAMLLTVREEDRFHPTNNLFQGVYAMAGYATGHGPNNSYYFGIRRLPYSTNLNKNALMFRHISDGVALPNNAPIRPGGVNSQVHNTGEVWATMLWECYASLLNAHPFQEAQDRMKYYLVGGYKATPVNPTFVEARNAILSVAAANDPADLQRLANAFAKRGLGVRAVAPDRNSANNAGAVESSNTGADLEFVNASLDTNTGDNDPYLDNGELATLNFVIRNSGFQSLSNSTATISSDNPHVTFPGGSVVNLPNSQPFGANINGSVQVLAGGMINIETVTFTISFNDPAITLGAPAPGTLSVRLNADEVPQSTNHDQVETVQTPWTLGGNSMLDPTGSGKWRRIRPAGGLTNQLWFGADVGVASDQYLISPDLVIGPAGILTIDFDHSYGFETDAGVNYDGGVIEMSVDNGPWTDIGGAVYNGVINGNYAGNLNPLVNRPAFVGSSGGMIHTTITTNALTASLAPGSNVKVRFRVGSDNAVGANGWQVDNIAFGGITNFVFPTIVPQGIVLAANVSVSGRVMRKNGGAIAGAVVTITLPDGQTRSARTSSFGYYRFDSLPANENYILSAVARNQEFAPRLVTPGEDLTGVDFISLR